MLQSKKDMMDRAKAFYEKTAPFFRRLEWYVLIECCAGDGKCGVEFGNEQNIEKMIFVDIKEVNRFRSNTTKVNIPFEFMEEDISRTTVVADSVVIAIHSCGVLTDIILQKAVESRVPVAVMPCCYNDHMMIYDLNNPPDRRRLKYPSEKDYYDAFRLQYLREQDYQAFLLRIDPKITPMNNVLIGIPDS